MMRASVHAYCAHHVSGVVNRHAHCRRYRCTDSRLCRGTRSERAVVVVTARCIDFGGGGGGARLQTDTGDSGPHGFNLLRLPGAPPVSGVHAAAEP
jgi:hypothetical protein